MRVLGEACWPPDSLSIRNRRPSALPPALWPLVWREWRHHPWRHGVALLAVALGVAPVSAQAFPWMIHHGYTSCAQCHVDPSGAGILTDYGRAQGEILLRTHYEAAPENPGPVKDFLFGAFDLPDVLELQADVRGLLIPDPANLEAILMQADLRAALQTEKFSASASFGGKTRPQPVSSTESTARDPSTSVRTTAAPCSGISTKASPLLSQTLVKPWARQTNRSASDDRWSTS